MQYKTIDLCAGIGGIRKGFELAGDIKNVASAEVDEFACKTYEFLYHENPRNDVANFKFKEKLQTLHYDILLAGFPCQAFSSVGLRQGFEDKTKGTIFFDIAQIIKMTRPKAVFLENVQNLLSHDKKATFRTIVDTLNRQLNYHIVGVKYDENGNLIILPNAFIRNSKNFGIPQNRPRVYIIAFNREYFGNHLSSLPSEMPNSRSGKGIFQDLNEILEKDVEARYFLSSGYLETLERHIVTQRAKGYGFGYRIVNSPEIKHPIANTILATGGSGKERNLVFDLINGTKYKGVSLKGKYSPINDKCIRAMTPTEWGKLQGFIGYAFLDEYGIDQFAFPERMPISQQYKQFGNSVTIPVVEELARFVLYNMDKMYLEFSSLEKRLYGMYGNEFLVCHALLNRLGVTLRNSSIQQLFDVVFHFKRKAFRNKELSEYLNVSSTRASQILLQLQQVDCVKKQNDGTYCFCDYLSITV